MHERKGTGCVGQRQPWVSSLCGFGGVSTGNPCSEGRQVLTGPVGDRVNRRERSACRAAVVTRVARSGRARFTLW